VARAVCKPHYKTGTLLWYDGTGDSRVHWAFITSPLGDQESTMPAWSRTSWAEV